MIRPNLSTLIAAVLVLGASSLQAQVLVDPHGFESPFFTTTFNGTGQLNGQPSPAGPDTWSIGGSGSTATIQTAVVKSGTQAVQVDRGANADVRWADPVTGAPSIANALITISWDMRVQQTTGALGTFGPFFGMEAYDGVGDLGLLGSLGVDATTGDVLFQDADTGFFTETGVLAAFGVWNSYKVELNYQTHQYSVFVNDVLLDTVGFVDQNNILGGLDDFSDADISAIAAAGDAGSMALTGTAYFDNFLVVQSPVPEPTGLLLASLSTLLLGARRRAAR